MSIRVALLGALAFATVAMAKEKHVTFKKPAAAGVTNIAGTVSTSSPGHSTSPRPLPPYWIGVNIRPADPTLRSHLHLGDTGLVVQSLVDRAPAQAAGIKPDDVLVEAAVKNAKSPLRRLEDLIRAVNEAGDATPVQLRLIRDGKEQTVTATPAKRNAIVQVQ